MHLHHHSLLVLLSVVLVSCRAEKAPTMILNPLQRALMELRDAYATGSKENLCDANHAIAAECHVCEALGAPVGGTACCVSVDGFAKCHIRVLELFDEIEELETNVILPMAENGEIESGSDSEIENENRNYMWAQDEKDKRYGNLYGHSLGKRYGNMYGNSLGKRYGNLYGNTFGKRYGNLFGKTVGKRYGNLYGSTIGKRYGNLFGNLFSKFNKNRNRQ